jgi:hypothetical protein
MYLHREAVVIKILMSRHAVTSQKLPALGGETEISRKGNPGEAQESYHSLAVFLLSTQEVASTLSEGSPSKGDRRQLSSCLSAAARSKKDEIYCSPKTST